LSANQVVQTKKNENSVIIYSLLSVILLLIFWKMLTSIVFVCLQWKSLGVVNCLVTSILILCWTEERNSHRFGTTWGWVHDDSIFISGWTIPLRVKRN